jgi:uncharacterized protein
MMTKKQSKQQAQSQKSKTCVICNAALKDDPESKKWRPFCSKRCKMIDLGEWLSDNYRIPTGEAGVPAEHGEDDEG